MKFMFEKNLEDALKREGLSLDENLIVTFAIDSIEDDIPNLPFDKIYHGTICAYTQDFNEITQDYTETHFFDFIINAHENLPEQAECTLTRRYLNEE